MYLLSAIEQCEVESPPPEISGHIDRVKKWFLAHLVFSQFKENKLFQEDLVSSHFKVWAFGLCQRNRKENNELNCT
jgi:hypothetical protein